MSGWVTNGVESEFQHLLKQKRRSFSMRRNTECAGISTGSHLVLKNQYEGRALGVLTSGGDSQGMNAALRAIVRMGIYLGCKVYLIHEGYQGLVDGGKNFQLASWSTVSGIVGMGGTIIGSARCDSFRQRSGRLKAALNLIKAGMNNLVCIGGDGTLTGANLFRKEWLSLLDELADNKQITHEEKAKYPFLNIVGLVASIDNDFCGTDMTIGANSALHRIMESIDAIVTTALSHQRCFVLEVMGRHCGYLALSAGLASEADWILLPENPPKADWEDRMCMRLASHREEGHRLNIIIVAEGAIDQNGQSITAEYVKNVVQSKLKIDTRVTKLGHVQRGGTSSAFDRILATRLGSEAVLALMMMAEAAEYASLAENVEDLPFDNSLLLPQPIVIAIAGVQTIYIPLEESVEKTRQLAEAMEAREFDRVIELRGASFRRNLETYLKMSKLEPSLPELNSKSSKVEGRYRLAVLNIGAPASGMNSAVRSFVRHAITAGCVCLGVQDGFEGLVMGMVKPIEWKSVNGWTGIGGSILGCQQIDAEQVGLELIARKIREFKIDGMIIVGGFKAFTSVYQMKQKQSIFKEFSIPLICIPATISNNVPGTHYSIGCDTSLNEIVSICDKIKQSAMGSKRRVFLIETMGGFCGYLASASGLASGADASYIFEEPFTINDLIDDIRHLKTKMQGDLKRGLLIRNEMANENYSSRFIEELMSEEGKGVFSARLNILGHMQQGGCPSPFDRNLGIKMGAKAAIKLIEMLDQYKQAISSNSSYSDLIRQAIYGRELKTSTGLVVGMFKNQIGFSCIQELADHTDFEHRLPKKQWWLNLRPLIRILGKHEAVYISEISRQEENDLVIEDKDESQDDHLIQKRRDRISSY